MLIKNMKMNIKTLNTQYSEITVEKKCKCLNGVISFTKTKKDFFEQICRVCKGKGKIISKHIVSNNGWLPLKFWINKFKKEK